MEKEEELRVINIKRCLISEFDSRSYIAESYNILRTNISFCTQGNPHGSLLITSPTSCEGKTLTALNLSLTYAKGGERTVLVETDLRRPIFYKLFFKERYLPGITEVLVGKFQLSEVIMESGYPNLSVILSGHLPPNPSDLLKSERMKEIADELRNKFSVVIFDSPPVLGLSDSLILASVVKCRVLLVARTKYTSKQALISAKKELERVGVDIIGVVINMVDDVEKDYYYSEYYKYYEK